MFSLDIKTALAAFNFTEGCVRLEIGEYRRFELGYCPQTMLFSLHPTRSSTCIYMSCRSGHIKNGINVSQPAEVKTILVF